MSISRDFDYTGIFAAEPQQKKVMGKPGPVQASKKLRQVIEDAQQEHPGGYEFADWFANYLEGYAAHFAHPSFDASEGSSGDGPECSLCGVVWPFCGHHYMSAWTPVNRGQDKEK